MAGARMRRVNEAVREVLSAQLAGGLKDPRIGFVTVTGVETAPDLRSARVYVSVLGDESARDAALEGLRSSRGFLQAHLAEELRLLRPDESYSRASVARALISGGLRLAEGHQDRLLDVARRAARTASSRRGDPRGEAVTMGETPEPLAQPAAANDPAPPEVAGELPPDPEDRG